MANEGICSPTPAEPETSTSLRHDSDAAPEKAAVPSSDPAQASTQQLGLHHSRNTSLSGSVEGASDEGGSEKGSGWKIVVPFKDRLPARRRACVCGSGKKYKNCCGVAKGAAARRKKAEEEKAASASANAAVPMSNLYI